MEKADQVVVSAMIFLEIDDELDFLLCTMDNVIIKQFIQSTSSANKVSIRMQNYCKMKQVKFFDEFESQKSWSWAAIARAECVILTGTAFIPLLQELGLVTLEPPVFLQMRPLVFMMQC